jgi:hypothetical protein
MAKMPIDKLTELARKKPWLVGALAGGALGAPIGLMRSDEGEEMRGALAGGLTGAGVGALGGMGAKKLQDVIDAIATRGQQIAAAGGVGGLVGGAVGASKMAPWVKKRLMRQAGGEPEMAEEENKEAQMANETEKVVKDLTKDMPAEKQAEQEKVASDRVNSFDFGIDLFCQENGLNKQAFAEMLGFENEKDMAQGIIECLVSNQQEAPKANA